MKIKYVFLVIIFLFSIYSCNNGVDPATTTHKVVNRATLEYFWKVFQKAVADRDMETLESLYAPSARVLRFKDEEYQEKIAAGKASDISLVNDTFKGEKVYQFIMVFPPETISDDGENEESTTTIYIWKNDEGEYEILNVLEAG